MKHVTILALQYASASCTTGLMELFCIAGAEWNSPMPPKPSLPFQVEVVSIKGGPVMCNHGITVHSTRSIEDVEDTDLVVIPAIGVNLQNIHRFHQPLIPWLRQQFEKGTHIASVCTGAFILAETGLLSGKTATTHWAFTSLFQKLYSDIDLKPERLITDSGRLYCSAGSNGYYDLALYLIEKYCGHDAAALCAQSLSLDLGKIPLNPNGIFQAQKAHLDKEILAVQEWIENHYTRNVTSEELANQVGMSPRNFNRRFKKATGDSFIVYLQRLRVEAAKEKLERAQKSVEEISYQIGYENISFFRKLFKRHTGLSPNAYRKKFKNRPDPVGEVLPV